MSTRPGFFDAVVARREALSDHLVRIELERPADWHSTGIPDEWVAVTVPGQFQTRYYTVRAVTAVALIIDVVVHQTGLVTEWAQGSCVGDVLAISEPKGSCAIPAEAGWVVLVGDLTALPAIARIRESATVPVLAWVESPDGPLPSYVEGVEWLDAPSGGSRLAQVVAEMQWPEGPGYLWMAGESAQMREIRHHVRRTLGWSAAHHDLMGYWSNTRARAPRAVDPGPIYARGKAAGKSDEEIWAEYDEGRSRG